MTFSVRMVTLTLTAATAAITPAATRAEDSSAASPVVASVAAGSFAAGVISAAAGNTLIEAGLSLAGPQPAGGSQQARARPLPVTDRTIVTGTDPAAALRQHGTGATP